MTHHERWLRNIREKGHPGGPPSIADCREATEEERQQLDQYAWEKAPSGGVLWEYFWRLKARQILGPDDQERGRG